MSDKSENIKSRILFPLIIVGVLLFSLSLTGGYWLQKKAIENSVNQRISGAHSLYQSLLYEQTQVMSGQIDFIKSDRTLLAAFLAGDRPGLVDQARPLFERMRSKYRITHFYFHGPDAICFLRVHTPDRHGDPITRFTMTGAASSGQPSYGIELGPLGTFTLRVVHPWMVAGQLAGYIELGMEIEHLTQLVKQALNLELLVLINKKFLKQDDWEAGLTMLKRSGNWDLYNSFVTIDQTLPGSPALNKAIGLHQMDNETPFVVQIEDQQYRGRFKDLMDAGHRKVGEIVSLVNVTAQHKNLFRLVSLLSGLFLVIGGGLLVFFSRYIGGIQNRLLVSRTKLLSEIEKRHEKEKALAISERQFRSLFEESKDAIINTDMDGNFLMVNPAGIEMFGLEDLDTGLGNFRNLYVDQAMVRTFAAKIAERGYIRNFGVQLNGKENKVIDCLMTVTTKRSAEGTLIGYEGIIRDVTPYKKMELELRRLATIDNLTSINNRRHFMDLTQKEMNRSNRYGRPLSLILMDIDYFKKVNDTYGHATGDQVLIAFCTVCLDAIRESDFMGRVGGEEFAVAAVECDAQSAVIVAERIRRAVEAHTVTSGNQTIRFTVSLGIAQMWPGCELKAMLAGADKALYEAKENGRNQVQIMEPIPSD